MSGFPSLKPALTALVEIDAPLAVGNISKGSGLNVVPITGGTLKSEPGFSPAVDAQLISGSDYIYADPSGKFIRLNAKAVLKNKDGALISFNYTGHIAINESTGAVLQGSPDAKTTDFGDAFTHAELETGADNLRELETSQFVAAGRFIIEKGKPVTVEYKLSQVGK